MLAIPPLGRPTPPNKQLIDHAIAKISKNVNFQLPPTLSPLAVIQTGSIHKARFR